MFGSNSMVGAALMALIAPSFSHMILREPKPFGLPNNSPLDRSGADFPCKIGTIDFTRTQVTPYKSGDQAVLGLTGSAVHGGGSCQISISTDKIPTKNSKFKVIYSIEGGCPSYINENFPEDANGHSATNFTFAIPQEVPNGDLTLSWSWVNRIGQREFYHNCAPISVSGGATDLTAFNDLPDMAVANIPSQGNCGTTETFNYLYDKPGKYVIRNGTGPYMPLCGGPEQQIVGEAAPERLGEVNHTGPAAPSAAPSQAPAQPSGMPETPASVPAAQPSSIQAPHQAPTSPPQTPATGGGSTCSQDGAIVCNGETQFGICNHGAVVFMPVAAGTKCSNGAIAKRDYVHRNLRTRV